MKIAKTSTPYGYTIFCDDFREEVNGKVTLVGIYRSEMIFNGPLPAALPKFCFAVSYFERPGESSEPLQIRVYLPGDAEDAPTGRLDIPSEFRENAIPTADDTSEASERFLHIFAPMVVTPLHLKQEGRIRVRAYRGDLEVRLGSLRIRQGQSMPPDEPS